jgi:cytochrome c553
MKTIPLLGIGTAALALATATFAADAGTNWAKDCASCHNSDGTGQSRVGRMLKVRDLTDAQVQKSFTDDEAVKSLEAGLTDKDGRVKMKSFQDKLSDDECKALVAYVRTLAK